MGLKGGIGASPPARGSTPAPRPKLGDYSYIKKIQDKPLLAITDVFLEE